LLVGVPAGYGLARMRAQGGDRDPDRRASSRPLYLIPLFLLFQWLGLLGTLYRRSSSTSW
jgi:multiple sugar transport system permease protein